ncbi:MAG: hypothetical protein J7499_04715 [Sphingopyxis sp.]|nr:hypothetical protein [Sphingopyxis sp.]
MTKIFPRPGSATTSLGFIARLKTDQKGGVLMIMGFAIIPLTFILGFGIDYARAMSLQTKLNAAADAAALAAVAPAMILQSNSEATSAATNMFNAQASLESGYEDLVVTPTITDGTPGSGGAIGYLRKATVSYTAKSTNMFGGLLGADTLTVSGTATANAAQPPNVDFYLAMDNSPSMLIPATSDGVTRIINATKDATKLPNGCAFACHMQMPQADGEPIFIRDTANRYVLLSTGYYTPGSSKRNVWYRWDKSTSKLYDSLGVAMNSTTTSGATTTTITYSIVDSTSGPVRIRERTKKTGGTTSDNTIDYDTGYWGDGYWLTHNYGKIYTTGPATIPLRKDEMVLAATQLIPFATNQAAQYRVTYRAQMFSFDWTRSGKDTPINELNTLQNVASYSTTFSAASIFPADDYWWLNNKPTSSLDISDKATEFTNMLTKIKAIIPEAGTGAPGDVPQKILFIISDGMLDQPSSGARYFGPLRESDLAECTAIKAKKIKIAILYTQYLPESLAGNTWSQNNVAKFLPPPPSPYTSATAGKSDQVLTALQKCASVGTNGAPLVQIVTANDNITTALQQLFSTALQTARLVR